MKTLDRNRIDGIVGELETEAYRLALALVSEPASADRILLEAFSSLAPSLARAAGTVELREKLHARIRQAAARRRLAPVADERSDQAVAVSESLHLRIVDFLEEEQAVEPVGRRKAVLVGVIGVLLVGALAAFLRDRSDALAAAQPTVTDLIPVAGAKEVAVDGEFRITFRSRPAGTPSLRLNPAAGRLEQVRWEGRTLVADYSGLHQATRYDVVLAADYRSGLNDIGHYEKRWTLTTEGYPVVLSLTPSEGQTRTMRLGQISIAFDHRPPVEPRVIIMPADGTTVPGRWNGSSWTMSYTGLKALTQYQATLTVDYGVAAANIRRQWTFSTEPGAPPPGVPVIWFSSSNPVEPQTEPHRLLAIDWHGNLAGTTYLTAVGDQQAPDGSALYTQDGTAVDRSGIRIGTTGNPYAVMAADDSKSICTIGDPGGRLGGQLWLLIGPVRGPMRRVAPANWVGTGPAPGIIACSVANDRVVVADSVQDRGLTSGMRVIGLSTGRVLYQRSYAGLGAHILSSRDGRYVAEQMPILDAQGQLLATVTLIRRTADGRVVARLDKQRVVRFSWDGMRVVTASFVSGFGPYEVQLLEWQTGKILWRQAADGPVGAMAQPNGPTMAIAVGSQPTGEVGQLWLIAADGRATPVVNEVLYLAVTGGF